MSLDPGELSRLREEGLPPQSGTYLVSIQETATTEYFPDFQLVYFDRSSKRFHTEIYKPDEGTMEPQDVSRLVTGWWHLPSAC
jgi:hypothetical protein